MELALAIMDYALVAMNIYLAKCNEGTSKKLNIVCAVLWLMCGILNTLSFISAL